MNSVRRRRGSSSSFVRPTQSETVAYLENGLSWNHQILQWHLDRHALHPYRIWRHQHHLRSEVIVKKPSKMTPSGGNSRKQFVRESRNCIRLSGIFGPTNLLDTTSLAVSAWLQNAINYSTKVRKTGRPKGRIIRLLFNLDYRTFCTDIRAYPKAIPDMTSLGTSDRNLSKYEKKPKMLPPTALSRISPERFKRGSQNYTLLSWTISPANLPYYDVTSCFRSAARCI